MMRDGKILCALSPTPTSANHFPSPTTFNEFDYNTNAFTAVTAPGGGASVNISSYVTNMLVLPDGNVLYCEQGATLYYLYNPGAALAAGKPTITTITENGNGSYHLVGTQLNGISQGASYGDDWQMATNYPIIRITSGGNVSYCRTYGWSNTAVMTGGTPVTTEFTMPPSVPAGTYSLEVVANGIPSDPVSFTVAPVAPTVTSPTQTNILATTATLGGNVTSDGGGGIIERGVVYSVTSVNSNPSIGGTGVTKMTSLGATGVFTVNVTGLAQGTGYSFKAYATNVAGTIYTTPVSTFTTPVAVVPTVTTPTQTAIAAFNATLGGNVTSDGGATITERGVVYSITSVNNNPLISGTGVTKVTGAGTTGVFTVNVSGLTASTGYSFKAYAINSVGTTYTSPVSTFTTLVATPLTGTKTVGAGGDYTSLTNAGGLFEAINNNGVNGLLSIQITGDLTAEAGAVALNALTGTTPSVKIFPTVAARAISGTSTGALIRLNAADNVTLDGSLGGTGTDRSLSVTNTNTGTSSAVIWLQNNGADGATNNTIKNLNVAGNGNAQTLVGIGSGSSTISTASLGTGNNNNTIQNNSISKTQYGIYSQGASAAAKNTGNVITQNLVNAASPNNVKFCGIRVGFENGIQISNNNISNLSTTNSLAAIAVGFSGVLFSTTSTTGNDVTNATITGNLIGSVLSTSATGYSAMGIAVSSVSSGTTTIANNIVTGVSALSTSPDFAAGIFSGGGTGTSLTNIYYNSVSMTGTRGAATYPSYALAIGGTSATPVNVRNNALYNTQTSTGAGKSYAIGLAYSTYATLTSNYNDLFASGTSSVLGAVGSLSAGTAQTTLANWQATTGKDANSVFGDPLFTSTTDLHITSISSPASNAGTPVAGITTDFDGAVRSGTTPDIGADEFGISNNADLVSLGMTPGTFSPVFASATQGYFATVPNGTTSVTVTPTVLEPNATVKVQVNGGPLNAVISGNPSGPLPLIVGANTINIVVTAQDTTTAKPYTITVTRQTVYQTWAAGFGVSTDPSASGGANLLSFSFGMKPGSAGGLVYTGTFAGGGSIAATGTPITMSYITNPADVRALFVRRKDYVAAGLTYTVQFSPGVTSWSNSADAPAVLADDGINQIVSVPYPALLIGAGVAFFRVQVTIAP